MRTSTSTIAVIGLAAGLTAVAVAPSSAADAPTAAGCYLVLPASHQDDGTGAELTSKIDVADPTSVTLAADCAGAPVTVDDILSFQAFGPDGAGGMLAQNFAVEGCRNATLPPINVTPLFKSGTYSVTLSTAKDWNCTGPTSNPNLYLIVTPPASAG